MKALVDLAGRLAIFALFVVGFAATGRGAELLHDDFSGPDLDPAWRVQRGYAQLETIDGDGWVLLHGSTPDTRDSAIVAGEHSDWSDYRFSTRFFAEGGGDDWYMALIQFRVQEMSGWSGGTYYYFWISTPLWGDSVGVANVGLAHRQDGTDYSVCQQYPPPGVVNGNDNTVVVEVTGGRIRLWMNDFAVLDCTDPDPIPTGGVALGAVWEARTRFDYAYVDDLSLTTACDDGVDNDGDGAIDFPADPGCASAGDDSEHAAALACDDGVDNDGDGKIDYPADPGCLTLTDPSELGLACDVAMSKPAYAEGEPVVLSSLRFTNSESRPVRTRLRLQLKLPSAFIHVVNGIDIGADGSFHLPANFDNQLGPVTMFTLDQSVPIRGDFEWRCALEDPDTGAVIFEDRAPFRLQ